MPRSSQPWLPSLAAVAALAFLALGAGQSEDRLSPTPATSAAPALPSFSDPASPLVLVNKQLPLVPADYAPADLVQPSMPIDLSGEAALLNRTTAAAAEAMSAAAVRDGVTITLASGYRSYTVQAGTFDGHVAALGQDAADNASARAGHSEHQTGWAMDIGDGSGACSFEPCFADQPAAVWAAAHAHRFGFILRYPAGAEAITGYGHEPWHLRYVGVDAATEIHDQGFTLEEFAGRHTGG